MRGIGRLLGTVIVSHPNIEAGHITNQADRIPNPSTGITIEGDRVTTQADSITIEADRE